MFFQKEVQDLQEFYSLISFGQIQKRFNFFFFSFFEDACNFFQTSDRRYFSGFVFLRPEHTFHVPSRKFWEGELFASLLREIYPVEDIIGKCFVMTLIDFIKGIYLFIYLFIYYYYFLFFSLPHFFSQNFSSPK